MQWHAKLLRNFWRASPKVKLTNEHTHIYPIMFAIIRVRRGVCVLYVFSPHTKSLCKDFDHFCACLSACCRDQKCEHQTAERQHARGARRCCCRHSLCIGSSAAGARRGHCRCSLCTCSSATGARRGRCRHVQRLRRRQHLRAPAGEEQV